MAGNAFTNGAGEGRNGLAKIMTTDNLPPVPSTNGKSGGGGGKVGHDYHSESSTVKAQTIDELHSLQKKRSAPSTPIHAAAAAQANFAATVSEELRQKQQLESIRLFYFIKRAVPRIRMTGIKMIKFGSSF